jgi:hypothetical protein
MNEPDSFRLLYVAGSMRSGTTLLSRLLSEQPGCLALGEMTDVWRALRDNEQCSCGNPAHLCPVWSVVLEELALDPKQLDRLHAQSVKLARWSGLFRIAATPQAEERLNVEHYLERLLSTVSSVTGCSVLIDSSKTYQGYLMRTRMPAISRLRLVHITRDPRGVVASDVRTRQRSKGSDIPPGRSFLRSTIHWILTNTLLRVSPQSSYRYVLSYESLIGNPELAISRITNWANLPRKGRDSGFGSSHVLVGNPSKMESPSKFHIDDRWQHELSPFQKWFLAPLATLRTLLLSREGDRLTSDAPCPSPRANSNSCDRKESK